MRINDRNLAGTASAETARTRETQKPERENRPDGPRQGTGTDRVELSGLAGRVSHSLAAASTSREARVAALAADFRAGRYSPDAHATSRAMIDEALAGGAA